MTDPKKQPIAALVQKWRDDISVSRRQEGDCAIDYRIAEAYEEIADDLESAIEAQCKEWEESLSMALGYEADAYGRCIRDLKGKP